MGFSVGEKLLRPSGLLNPSDNQRVASMLKEKEVSVATAVVQFFTSLGDSSPWEYRMTGVACLIKDSRRRSYFIQLLDMDAGQLAYEQEIYVEFRHRFPKKDVVIFDGDNCMGALYFAEQTEAEIFLQQIENRLSKLHRPRPPIKFDMFEDGARPIPKVVHVVDMKQPGRKGARPAIKKENFDLFGEEPSSGYSKPKQKSKSSGAWFGTWSSRSKPPKVNKADIGPPTNPLHLEGVKATSEGFKKVDNLLEVEPGLRQLFAMTGMDITVLQNPEARKQLEEFAQKNKEALIRLPTKKVKSNNGPPLQQKVPYAAGPKVEGSRPPPTSGPAVQSRSHKPPTPPKGPPPAPSIVGAPPPPPPPPAPSIVGAPPPPPPPPPIMPQPQPSSVPENVERSTKEPNSRNDMLASIQNFQKGSLQHVDPNPGSVPQSGGRDNMLGDIKNFDPSRLKRVSVTETKPSAPQVHGILGVLQKELDKIAQSAQLSDSEDEEDPVDSDDWDD